MKKLLFIFIGITVYCLLLHSLSFGDKGLTNPVVKIKTDKSTEVFIFNGFNLENIQKDKQQVVNKDIPVTKDKYFAIFFLKDNFFPEIKIVRATGRDINIDFKQIRLKKQVDDTKGILTGIVYKPITGGKTIFRQGILNLIKEQEIKIIDEELNVFTTKTNEDGIFTISLPKGKYTVSVGDDKGTTIVVIENKKVAIKNFKKGIVLVD